MQVEKQNKKYHQKPPQNQPTKKKNQPFLSVHWQQAEETALDCCPGV